MFKRFRWFFAGLAFWGLAWFAGAESPPPPDAQAGSKLLAATIANPDSIPSFDFLQGLSLYGKHHEGPTMPLNGRVRGFYGEIKGALGRRGLMSLSSLLDRIEKDLSAHLSTSELMQNRIGAAIYFYASIVTDVEAPAALRHQSARHLRGLRRALKPFEQDGDQGTRYQLSPRDRAQILRAEADIALHSAPGLGKRILTACTSLLR